MNQELIDQSQLGKLVPPVLAYLEDNKIACERKNSSVNRAYETWRDRFMLVRMQLVVYLGLFVCCTLVTFFSIQNLIKYNEIKLHPFFIGGSVSILLLFFLVVGKIKPFSSYPHIIFLCLCWSVTIIEQIGVIIAGYTEPQNNLWTLIFLMNATLVPVRWELHLISQVGTIACYLLLYQKLNLQLEKSNFFYSEQAIYLFWVCVICCLSVYLYECLQKKEFFARKELELAQEKSEKLLLNILPQSIADRLKQQSSTIADSFSEVTVLFADIVGFTELSAKISPIELVKLLNQIFSMFDGLAEKHQLEKIKTIGDAYLVVAGLPNHRVDRAEAIANMALDMQAGVEQFNQITGQSFRIRIGISTGPVVAGVIGVKKFAYDLWGDTVNTASRMESHGIAGQIQVCELTYKRLKNEYSLTARGAIAVKGKGQMNTYLLKGKL